ncbi:MAG: glutathione S-transferase [Pseudomonadota bacterium]
MSPRFTLHYWPIPFRAQPLRYLLAYADVPWQESETDALVALYKAEPEAQPLPFMGFPILHDREADLWLSQMPAIAGYLGSLSGLMPSDSGKAAETYKVLGDVSDVLQAMTLDCGAQMWTPEAWEAFAQDRFLQWLQIFEVNGQGHGLAADSGTLLGTPEPGVADLACAALWVTMAEKLPKLEALIAKGAPLVWSLSNRIAAHPRIAALRAEQQSAWGEVWCEGEIEQSLRSALAAWDPTP